MKELSLQKKAGKDMSIKKFLEKKASRPLMLGETLNKEVQAYIQETRKIGGVVNARIGIACATGICEEEMVTCLLLMADTLC